MVRFQGSIWRRVAVNLLVLVCLGALAESNATLVQTNSNSNTSQTAFPASATDLANTGQSTLLSRTEASYAPFTIAPNTSTANALNDGTLGSTTGSTNPDLSTVAFDGDGTWTTTFTFDTSVNTLGYDIRSINTISGWVGGRTNQQYTLQFTTVGNATPQNVGGGSFNYKPGLGGTASTQIALTDSGGAGTAITGLTGVKSLIFGIQVPSGNGSETVYREIDITGVASVPEPASLGMLAAGMLLLAMARRRLA